MPIYPIVKLPKQVAEILTASPPVKKKLLLPPTPPVKALVEPPTVHEKKSSFSLIGLLCLLMGIGMLFHGIQHRDSTALLPGTFCLLVAGIIWLVSYLNSAKSINANERALHNTRSTRAEEEFNQAQQKYHVERVVYEEEIRGRERQYEAYLANPIAINTFRKNGVIEFFSAVPWPDEFDESVSPKQGVSEKLFFKYLKDKFGTSVTWGKFSVPINFSSKSYYPDFILTIGDIFTCDEDAPQYDEAGNLVGWATSYTGLNIDIEIDEPYVASTGKPIHYVGDDVVRDSYFTDAGWVVIRFTEKQICENPTACVDFIAQQIEQITLGALDNLFSYDENNIVIQSRQWTEEEGRQLAFEHYRDTYLPSSIINSWNSNR